jgi:hypothetical protein
MTFDQWWEQFVAEHEDWQYADYEALRKRAFEAGIQSERVVTIQDDDDLRFIKRVLEGNNPTEADKTECLRLIHNIRTRARRTEK